MPRQRSTDSISAITANVKDTLNKDPTIASVVSLARIAGESVQVYMPAIHIM